jgi:hypothetical protein
MLFNVTATVVVAVAVTVTAAAGVSTTLSPVTVAGAIMDMDIGETF